MALLSAKVLCQHMRGMKEGGQAATLARWLADYRGGNGVATVAFVACIALHVCLSPERATWGTASSREGNDTKQSPSTRMRTRRL
jgi:hypothetical protein